jgi:long-chain acyl-CoA synthetase
MADTTVHILLERARRSGEVEAIRELAAGGAPADEALTWGEWARRSRGCAAALVDMGLEPGDRVAILAGNRMVWPIAEFGSLMAGLVTVGVYPTSTASQIREVLADCQPRVVITGDAEQHARVEEAMAGMPPLMLVTADSATHAVSWESLLDGGMRLLDSDAKCGVELETRLGGIEPATLAALVYTSGSTGQPKGAMLSHRYLLASAESIRQTLGLVPDDRSLSVLPFCHAGERVFGLHTRVFVGMSGALVADYRLLWDAARSYRPTLVGGVPRFYEKLHDSLTAAAIDADRAEDEAWKRNWIQAAIGGAVRLATSGGAMLNPRVAADLSAVGLPVLGAYGLTEHLCVAFNRPERHSFSNVGLPMPGTELRIADDGEVMVRRSALSFSGYWGKLNETAAAFTGDGEWIFTGDFGSLDADGSLAITGRKKELIALAAGKKVAPLAIEARLVSEPWISQAVCYGEGKHYLTALISLRRDLVEQWAHESSIEGDYEAILGHPELLRLVSLMVDRVNETVAPPERVRRFTLLDRDLSVEAGELTETLKLRRSMIAERYRERLESLYQQL